MDEHLQANQILWDQWTIEHEKSPFYDLASFRAGKDRLRSIELSELGDVSGKSLLHLQCHFGMDTLAWARRGALVTGVDFSEKSIALARSLSQELNIPAQFVCCDLYQLPDKLSGAFDIVFTSYGVLHWLRDLPQWGKIIAHFLKPHGIFYIVEDHPTFRMFTTEEETKIKCLRNILRFLFCFRFKPESQSQSEHKFGHIVLLPSPNPRIQPPTAPRSKYRGACAMCLSGVDLPVIVSGQQGNGAAVATWLLSSQAHDDGG